MTYVHVNIITPDERMYEAEVDENAPDESLLSRLIKTLSLQTTATDGNPIRYSLSIIGGLRIREGATIKIYRSDPHDNSMLSIPKAHLECAGISNIPIALATAIQAFKSEHDSSKTIFVMMKFAEGNTKKNKKLENLFSIIKLELDKYNLEAVRADEKTYSATQYLWDNLQIYLNGCNYGIAVLENVYLDEMNPNVALEYGYMLAQRKQILLLKEKSFLNIRADILGKLWKEFEIDKKESIQKAIQNWMVDLVITRIKA